MSRAPPAKQLFNKNLIDKEQKDIPCLKKQCHAPLNTGPTNYISLEKGLDGG